MRYPQLAEIPRQVTTTENWLGYNHNRRIADGENYEEWNIGSDEAPVLTPRRKRGTFAKPFNPQGLIAKECLCWIDGSKFVMDGEEIEMGLSERPEDCPKQLVSMGANVIILPDKKYINTKKPEDRGDIEASFSTGGTRWVLCQEDGVEYNNATESAEAPADPENGQYWIDTGSQPNALKMWSETECMWVSIGTTYVKVEAPGIGDVFGELDGVTISGAEGNESLKAMMGSHVIWRKGDGYIVLIGMLPHEQRPGAMITIKREMPNLDYVIESGNRLWGCRYGIAKNGETVNEIYASKQGDFKNWNCFMGLVTDSWVGNCGSDGPWTGAINYMGYPMFFKEDHIHKVYGNQPSQYSIQDTAARGVQRGSGGSLAVVNEVLFYKSKSGVCVYDGSLPTDIADALGQESYCEAVAGAHENRYYISMLTAKDRMAVMMTYDTKARVWHKEDDLRPMCWASSGNEMFCIDSGTGNIVAVTGAGEQEEEPVEWEIITGEIGLKQNSGFAIVAMPEEKYIGKLALRMQLDRESELQIWIQYDGAGAWDLAASMRGTDRLRSFTLPIRPKRCDWLRLKIKGVGMARIYSLTKWVEGASEYSNNEGATLDF